MAAVKIEKFNRINLIEQWLFQLELPELNKQEASTLLMPPEDVKDKVFESLVRICNQRYKSNSFWPDFKIIGLESVKTSKKLERIFGIGL